MGTLTFPRPTKRTCNQEAGHGFVAHESNNDITGITASALSINDVKLDLGGKALTLGGGGLAASSASPSFFGPDLSHLPITLGADQTWSIDGGHRRGGNYGGSLDVGVVTGSSRRLAVKVKNGAGFSVGSPFFSGNDVEVGPVAIVGADAHHTGNSAALNGTAALFSTLPPGPAGYLQPTIPARLNGVDGNPVSVEYAALSGRGTVGPLASRSGMIDVGESDQIGILHVTGGVTLDAKSAVQMRIANLGTTPGIDYSQISASATVALANSHLMLTEGRPASMKPSCPPLCPGSVDTLVTTTGAVVGRFAGISDGASVRINGDGVAPLPIVRINYTVHTVTATILRDLTPSTTQIETLLRNQIIPARPARRIAALLKAGGYTLPFKAPTDGNAIVAWYYIVPPRDRGKSARLLVARGSRRYAGPGTASLNIKLTSRGEQLLKRSKRHARPLNLIGSVHFEPTNDPAALAHAEKIIVLK